MKRLALEVNGEALDVQVEPRTHLADFLREQCHLTGTHLGCEHGVCGACTVLIDGAPARSCITYAAACEGSSVRTVEGFPDDPLMTRLREAFHREHALQCGYCTPGMLIAAYDIVRRRPDADEAEIRLELAGNLCRCTGYVGIVSAIKRVIAETPADAKRKPALHRAAPAGPLPRFTPVSNSPSPPATATAVASEALDAPAPGWTRVSDSFTVARPPAEVWSMLGDVARMAGCMPGAVLDGYDGSQLRGHLNVRMGPIRTSFAGTAVLERDDQQLSGRLTGGGGDARSGSRADGTVVYRLTPQCGGASTLVSVTMDFRLQGALAQFGRSGIVRDLIGRTVAEFAQNIGRLAGGQTAPASARHDIDAGRLVAASLWARLKAWWAAL
jgi:carbon-monoxide dehydrogenase small subunit